MGNLLATSRPACKVPVLLLFESLSLAAYSSPLGGDRGSTLTFLNRPRHDGRRRRISRSPAAGWENSERVQYLLCRKHDWHCPSLSHGSCRRTRPESCVSGPTRCSAYYPTYCSAMRCCLLTRRVQRPRHLDPRDFDFPRLESRAVSQVSHQQVGKRSTHIPPPSSFSPSLLAPFTSFSCSSQVAGGVCVCAPTADGPKLRSLHPPVRPPGPPARHRLRRFVPEGLDTLGARVRGLHEHLDHCRPRSCETTTLSVGFQTRYRRRLRCGR